MWSLCCVTRTPCSVPLPLIQTLTHISCLVHERTEHWKKGRLLRNDSFMLPTVLWNTVACYLEERSLGTELCLSLSICSLSSLPLSEHSFPRPYAAEKVWKVIWLLLSQSRIVLYIVIMSALSENTATQTGYRSTDFFLCSVTEHIPYCKSILIYPCCINFRDLALLRNEFVGTVAGKCDSCCYINTTVIGVSVNIYIWWGRIFTYNVT